MSLKCLFGHKWNGCKCDKCGKTRDVGHEFSPIHGSCREQCEKCGITRSLEHKFKLMPDRCVEKCTICGSEQPQHHWVEVSGYCVKKCSICGEMAANHEMIAGKCPKCGKEFLIKQLFENQQHYSALIAALNIGANIDNPHFDDKIKNLFGKLRNTFAVSLVLPASVFEEKNQELNELLQALNGKPIFQTQDLQEIARICSIIKSLELIYGMTKDIVNVDDETKKMIEDGVPSTVYKAISTDMKSSAWSLQTNGGSNYYSQKAGSLLAASEILKNLDSIPSQTYYLVDTPDGTLGRDINGFFTEAPIKTANLKIDNPCGKTESVQAQSLMGFGNMVNNQNGAALQKVRGQYAKLILMMKCGQCDYEFPIETVAGNIERQCYHCGTNNKTHRGSISVHTANGTVEV